MPNPEMSPEYIVRHYNLPEDALQKAGIQWDTLVAIYDDHLSNTSELGPTANEVAERLRTLPQVHSVRTRIKDAAHLIVKIIRKRLEGDQFEYNVENYRRRVTDLIGVRAIHLYKADWRGIHDYLKGKWQFAKKPEANIRAGDPTQDFKSLGLRIVQRKGGYRSLHYLVKSGPPKAPTIVEVQVRTIFEEGWSEIDHNIRYPYDQENPVLAPFLVMMNSLAGTADAMGSYIAFLRDELRRRQEEADGEVAAYKEQVAKLKAQIENLEPQVAEKAALKRQIEQLEKQLPSPFRMTQYLPVTVGDLFGNLGSTPSGSILDASSIVTDVLKESMLRNLKKG